MGPRAADSRIMANADERPESVPDPTETEPAVISAREDLMLAGRNGAQLNATQTEFNRLMKRLDKSRAEEQRERQRLNHLLEEYNAKIVPLIESLNRKNVRCVEAALAAWRDTKMTPRRRKALGDFIGMQAASLSRNAPGLSETEIARMTTIADELLGEVSEEEDQAEFEAMRSLLETLTRAQGLDVDFSDIGMKNPPEEVRRRLTERFEAAQKAAAEAAAPRPRKKTKAQIAREERLREEEEAKAGDIKSLYKRLARVLHPDLETEPAMKLRKEAWMKRLTAAHAAGDLRELLSIEIEWLGQEASNLATATDRKLKVYCTVLKEQIAATKEATFNLRYEPRYHRLFTEFQQFNGEVPPINQLARELEAEVAQATQRLTDLETGGPQRTRLLNRIADEHARDMDAPPVFFL